jgi:chaperonin GroES
LLAFLRLRSSVDGSTIENLLRFAKMDNVASEIEEEKLIKIGRDVVRLYKIDEDSREDWKKRSQDAMALALQVTKKKDFPFENASQVKYPLLTTSALQFHARCYPAVIQGDKVIKFRVTGEDPEGEKSKRAVRCAQFMNWQLLFQQEEWEEQFDRLLLALPIEGCEFKKSFYDPTLGRNVSEWIRPDDFVVHNKTKSLAVCPRMTHRLYFYPHEIEVRQSSGLWVDVNLEISKTDEEEETQQCFLEQHCLLDLDEDGVKEPWCVTVHEQSQKVVRIKAGFYPEDIWINLDEMKRLGDIDASVPAEAVFGAQVVKIDRIQYFTKYSFIPSPDGGFYDVGFGQLIGPLSDTIDTTINQIIDAGTLANTQGGFVREGVSVGGGRGSIRFAMGEYKQIRIPSTMPIGHAMQSMDFRGPSAVLFEMLQMLIQSVRDITGVQDINVGATPQNETATTTMIRVEEGAKVFTAIYKRIWRAMKEEFAKLYKLNSIYLQPETYFTVLDSNEQGVVSLQDFRGESTDIQPVADPTIATTQQRIAKAELLMGQMGNPLTNKEEITRRYLEAAEISGVDKVIIPEDQRQVPPDPKIELAAMKQRDEARESEARVLNLYAKTLEAFANAESKEVGSQLGQYRLELEALRTQIEAGDANKGRVAGMEGAPDDQSGVPPAEELPAGIDAGMLGGGEPGQGPGMAIGGGEQGEV